jgi:hypothetical protein
LKGTLAAFALVFLTAPPALGHTGGTMTTVTFDTLKFVETLKSSGLPEEQAKALARAFSDAHESAELATKNDLKLAMAELRADIIKWVVGLAFAQIALLIGILLKLPR